MASNLEPHIGKPISVYWEDIVSNSAWVSADSIQSECKTTTFQTVGLLIDVNSKFITVAGTWEFDMSTYGDCNSIPAGVIKNVSLLAIPMITEQDNETGEE